MIASLLCDSYWSAQCPICATEIALARSLSPEIDSCGFEKYAIGCGCCDGILDGIVDPIDDALLISLLGMSPKRRTETGDIVTAEAN
jgi:hypothetical protein